MLKSKEIYSIIKEKGIRNKYIHNELDLEIDLVIRYLNKLTVSTIDYPVYFIYSEATIASRIKKIKDYVDFLDKNIDDSYKVKEYDWGSETYKESEATYKQIRSDVLVLLKDLEAYNEVYSKAPVSDRRKALFQFFLERYKEREDILLEFMFTRIEKDSYFSIQNMRRDALTLYIKFPIPTSEALEVYRKVREPFVDYRTDEEILKDLRRDLYLRLTGREFPKEYEDSPVRASALKQVRKEDMISRPVQDYDKSELISGTSFFEGPIKKRR